MSKNSSSISQTYGVQRWGEGYFGINEAGQATVCPDPDRGTVIDLHELAFKVREVGLSWPVLIRFSDILHHRIRTLCNAFKHVSEELGYQGGYRAVYPVKVNQQRSVMEELIRGGGVCAGLEAGSKPELMAVISQALPGSVIVCNGYKDREYIRLALIARRLGHQIYIVIEKPSELDMVISESADLGVEPLLGVRMRLAAVAQGHWQNSGGEKSKFGLSACQLLTLVARLREMGHLDWLVLLHSHIGSQIANLREIRKGAAEAARYFSELSRLGVPIRVIDLGGGLGVDYEGTGTRSHCSINYSLEGYAREILRALARVCEDDGLEQPMVFTESGRALTAHHAVLITNVVDAEPISSGPMDIDVKPDDHDILMHLAEELDNLDLHSPLEVFEEAKHLFEESRELFLHGQLALPQRAKAENMFYVIARRVRAALRPEARRHRELMDQLNELLADRVFCNFSLFQSLPDVWGIDQIFPIMPLQRLDEPPTVNVVLNDITCDSDGCINAYVDQDGVETTLPMHEPRGDEPYLLGIFMAGAYQEILGDMHNLFGDTDAVNVDLTDDGGYKLSEMESGDAVDELLRYVHFDIDKMLDSYRRKLAAANLTGQEFESYFRELEAGLRGYTYFED